MSSIRHIGQPAELEAIEAPPRALEAILWLAFTIALVTSPAVVIAAYRVLL